MEAEFYAQCWDIQNNNSLFKLNLDTLERKVLLEGRIFGCASNAMAFRDDALYTPRPFEGRVVKVDLTSNPPTITNITTGMVSPNAVKFVKLLLLISQQTILIQIENCWHNFLPTSSTI